MRDARDAAQEAVNPILYSQGLDDYYLQKGIEYLAYESLRVAEEGLERSREQFEEATRDLPEAEAAFEQAQYEFDVANSREEYEYARGLLDEAEARLNTLRDRESAAREEVERLEAEVPDF